MENNVIISVIWRDKHIKVEMNADSNVKEFGQQLQKLTKVRADTMRLLVPQSISRGSKLVTPFSDEHSTLTLQETAILEGKPIRMMGVFEYEIEEVSKTESKERILGFDEEERRSRQRLLNAPQASLKLPQGTYIFCEFRTLHIPGIELNPPASEALRRMHMLACDPGIMAIMNKHRWRVGIMTEMAPEGYVGISPKCLLGFNKNQGEEISLRLRTDDLKGFRKYESVKETLLHELAHMVHSEHDSKFYALDKQLNKEAVNLDWTKSRSQTLSGQKISGHYEDELHVEQSGSSAVHKLGGDNFGTLTSARAASVAAAYNRLLSASSNDLGESRVQVVSRDAGRSTENVNYISDKEHTSNAAIEPDPDDSELQGQPQEDKPELYSDNNFVIEKDDMQVDITVEVDLLSMSSVPEALNEPDLDDCLENENIFEPDLDDSLVVGNADSCREPDPDDSQVCKSAGSEPDPSDSQVWKAVKSCEEPDPDDSGSKKIDSSCGGGDFSPVSSAVPKSKKNGTQSKPLSMEITLMEPDPDDCEVKEILVESQDVMDCHADNLQKNGTLKDEPDPDDIMDNPKNQEIQRLEEPVAGICTRLQKAIEMLRTEATPVEATLCLQTLYKIIRNVINHPDEAKFRKLRKTNPLFQRNVANYIAAMEVLNMIGFYEDVMTDEVGRRETYLVLKRNDPGLLWLAKSSLEVSVRQY